MLQGSQVTHSAHDSLARRARAALDAATQKEGDWIWIHALEVWVELGEKEKVRGLLLPRLAEFERSTIRIGIWRVLANSAQSKEERATWIKKIEQAFLEPAAADRLQAIETLGKLGHAPQGAVLDAARGLRSTMPENEALFPLWTLWLAGEQGAGTQLVGSLTSPEVNVRRRAAFIMRWLKPDGAWMRGALARALAEEAPDSIAQSYLLSTSLSLDLDSSRRREWAQKLEQRLPTVAGGVCLEACQALRKVYTPADLPRLAPLLEHAEADTRIGSAWTILHVLRSP